MEGKHIEIYITQVSSFAVFQLLESLFVYNSFIIVDIHFLVLVLRLKNVVLSPKAPFIWSK